MARSLREEKQVTGSNTYSLGYTYNHAGLLSTQTYPTGRVLTNSYDNAGRLSQISDGTTVFASSLSYAPSGARLSETWGNGAVHSIAYNNALQVSQVKLKQSSSGSELQRYDYLYGQVTQSNGSVDKSKNNGQVGRIDGTINGLGREFILQSIHRRVYAENQQTSLTNTSVGRSPYSSLMV